MIEILGLKITYETLLFFALFLASEVIGSNEKLKSNSVIQLLLTIVANLRPLRREDDKIERIRDTLRQ